MKVLPVVLSSSGCLLPALVLLIFNAPSVGLERGGCFVQAIINAANPGV
jgi:hypothetical protein